MDATSTAVRRAAWRAMTRIDGWANRLYGSRYNPLYHSGAIVIGLLLVLVVTGLYLILFYRLGSPWASVARITEQAWLGRWIRGVHRFASDAAVVAAGLHAFRMYAQHRSWGPRALAWVSGLVLVAVIFVCGWTGYVLVWDIQAQLLAVEGARFLDVLPLFSEPIGRTFVGERPLPNAFFFLNLFAHIALPIGVGLLVWIHVSRVARPVLLPPRWVLWGVVAALVALAVVWPVGTAPQADPLRLPERVPLDVFFAFWLPLTRRLPAWAAWAFGGALALAALVAPWWTRPSQEARPAKSQVDERRCTGCEQCVKDCPFDAITMVAREAGDPRPGLVARVNPDLCVSCGICTGSCAPMAVGPVGRTGRDQLALARAFLAREARAVGRVVVVGCEWSAASVGRALDGVPLLPVACAGNVHTSVIEHLLRGGAGGVLVAACPEWDCRSREGGKWLVQRMYHGREADLKARVDRRRVRIVGASAGEPAVLRAALEEFAASVAALADVDAARDGDPAVSGRTGDRDAPAPDLEEVAL
ncbi:MAG TPA: hydrogenase iron-sulfur subunit [Longimicrobiales bacterium]